MRALLLMMLAAVAVGCGGGGGDLPRPAPSTIPDSKPSEIPPIKPVPKVNDPWPALSPAYPAVPNPGAGGDRNYNPLADLKPAARSARIARLNKLDSIYMSLLNEGRFEESVALREKGIVDDLSSRGEERSISLPKLRPDECTPEEAAAVAVWYARVAGTVSVRDMATQHAFSGPLLKSATDYAERSGMQREKASKWVSAKIRETVEAIYKGRNVLDKK
jgi:hypothetical protein